MNFFSLPPRTMTTIAVLLGYLMIDDLTADEQNTLGNFLILIGQVLETNSAQQQLLNDLVTNQKINLMEAKIKALEQALQLK